MAHLALDIVLWLVGVRGHIPRFDDFRPAPPAAAAGSNHALRALAAAVVIFASLPLAIWAAVWLVIQLL
ncbi:hypothetical protein NLM33_25205 [Bradyrhizobium sp. CCGUVB1N3]|uniref:hypothetical protein n=1 Tax=Bradyrhizobium sp. CCGUVB1N3 TaxID=2949629 RepID=UPI0020B1EEE2|nr:hypothetical protein [Bradyrhizobium sp. CCGUVB1N3]MCP3473616.1 hypothetical protein [Bradyrhizobium sp. CCGUVB1N3]